MPNIESIARKSTAVTKYVPLLLLAVAAIGVGLPALAPAQERHLVRVRMTPDQRAQFQQQMADLRNRRAERNGEVPPPNAQHPRLSPEERRQLREQIRDAHRELNGPRRAPGNER